MGDVRELLPPAQRPLLAALEGLIDRVEKGEVVAVAYVGVQKDGGPINAIAGLDENVNVADVVYGLEMLKHRLLKHQDD